MPLRPYGSDVTLVSDPGRVMPACEGAVGRTKSTIEDVGRYIAKVVDASRGCTGRIEGHCRGALSYGTTAPAATEAPTGETIARQWVGRFRSDDGGGVSDCPDRTTGVTVPDPRSRRCEAVPDHDRCVAPDPGGNLPVVDDDRYMYRNSPAIPTNE